MIKWVLGVILPVLLAICTRWSYARVSARKSAFLEQAEPRHVLLVIAHPDDESMFFVPTIRRIQLMGGTVNILCLCNGDYDGVTTRAAELRKAALKLGVSGDVTVLDHSLMKDGPVLWSSAAVRDAVQSHIDNTLRNKVDMVLTFDDYGVSGHPNHIATYRGVKLVPHSLKYVLESVPIWRKYCIPLDALLLLRESNVVLSNEHTAINVQAMQAHASQWVWFRRLFVLLSRYTRVNSWRRL
ncbi:MAG: hypothetical protein MHM6MM_004658 [Cercozoa sp. M6MM]